MFYFGNVVNLEICSIMLIFLFQMIKKSTSKGKIEEFLFKRLFYTSPRAESFAIFPCLPMESQASGHVICVRPITVWKLSRRGFLLTPFSLAWSVLVKRSQHGNISFHQQGPTRLCYA